MSTEPTLPWPATEAGDWAPLQHLRAWIAAEGLSDLPPEHAALASSPFGVWLDLRRPPDSPWRELMLSQHTAHGLATWVTWVDHQDRPGAAYLPPGPAWALTPFLLGLMRRLRGDEIELRYALAGRQPLLPRGTWVHPDGWWDEWKSRPADEEGPTLGEIYRRWLYPRVRACLEVMEGPLQRVVDVCGGDGELLATLGPGLDLTLIERNHAACEAARARGVARVVEGDAADARCWQGTWDAVLLVGAIQGNVMTTEAARQVLGHARAALRPGGYAIVTGWSPCLLDAADMRAAGFQVLNLTTPPVEDDPNPRQLYVLRRGPTLTGTSPG